MKTFRGHIYALEVQLFNAAGISSHWLVGALAATYPQADLIAVDYYTSQLALLRILWKGETSGEITVGDDVSVGAEGIPTVGGVLPRGVVRNVREVGQVAIEPVKKVPNALKLAGAFALLVTTHYFAVKAGGHVTAT